MRGGEEIDEENNSDIVLMLCFKNCKIFFQVTSRPSVDNCEFSEYGSFILYSEIVVEIVVWKKCLTKPGVEAWNRRMRIKDIISLPNR